MSPVSSLSRIMKRQSGDTWNNTNTRPTEPTCICTGTSTHNFGCLYLCCFSRWVATPYCTVLKKLTSHTVSIGCKPRRTYQIFDKPSQRCPSSDYRSANTSCRYSLLPPTAFLSCTKFIHKLKVCERSTHMNQRKSKTAGGAG